MSEAKTGSTEFRQQVRMAAVQVAGLRPDELAQALAYEVEPLSGIPAPEAEVTYQPVVDADPTVRVYDVVVRHRARRKGTSGGGNRWLRLAVAFAVVVVVAMLGDGAWIATRRSALKKTVNERRPLQAELDRMHTETRTIRSAIEGLRSRRAGVARAQDEADALRRTHADILDELAVACVNGAVIRSITSGEDPRTLNVKAIDVSSEAAAGAMQTLSAHVSTNGWQLLPGEIAESGAGGTVSFSFELTRTR